MMKRALLLAAALVACSKEPDQPPADFSNPGAPAQPMPTMFSLQDFGHLRYLEGTWRGTMANGNGFYESYHFVNDSTILKGSHTDSTFRTKTDSSFIVFRGGAVLDSGTTVYSAEKLDSTVVDFRASPTYHFTWTKDGLDAWTARLFSRNPDGTDRVTVYPMKRVRP
jgi:hypothetical protein